MYYDKDEYTLEVNWYRDLITQALGKKWRPYYRKRKHNENQ